MKKMLLLNVVGILAGIAVLKSIRSKHESLRFIDRDGEMTDTDAKNFGAFPPEIPEHQFDALFV